MNSYIVYDIEACENLKFAKSNMQSDSEETMEYIPGTAIRGAYIYKYIIQKGIKNINEGIHRDKLLNGKIKFLNAYPKYKDKRSIPLPKSYFAPKEKIKAYNTSLKMKSGLDIKLDSGYEKVRTCEFVAFIDGEYYKTDVEKTSNLHINKMRGKKNNKLFRYEFIKKGQLFQGIIKVEDDSYLEEIEELFKDEIVYLGGSKGSGYGKCKIKGFKVFEENPEYEGFKTNKEFGEYIYLLALSDIIFRNEVGEYKTFIDEKYIAKELELDSVEFVDSCIEVKSITNFNNKWKCSTPIIKSIKAGSVFKYKISGNIDKEIFNSFLNKGIGERRLDGFGRFIILNSIEDTYLRENKGLNSNLNLDKESIDLFKKEKEQVNNIINLIYEKRLENDISLRVLELDEKLRNTERMSKSQWGNFKDLFTSLIYEEPKAGINKYNKYVENINSKRSTSFTQINQVWYENKKLIDFFNDFIENSMNLDLQNRNTRVKRVKLKGLESSTDREFLYKYNMRILVELCRFQIRKGEW
ncbi:hypothetical protein K8M07_11105 [Schnuerera sp. xch1]|uniref:RAMP superfamily CRISPR-associated protein n=1 Tax=Schnuerera sp. xch1 TaxID=2874283 RepID=UPI001CBB8A12|nr:RAMP superfamily CRISPR-associated protein [Schnuerera sp. xch1]MBZ2175785.1 hypothetical protein [Schnuerera sp. xch1]